MVEDNTGQPPITQGEGVQARMEWQTMAEIKIEAGEFIIPVQLTTDNAYQYSALQLIRADLEFARDCLLEANKLGIPNDSILHSKALIFAGIVAYARVFGKDVRGFSFLPEELISRGIAFDSEIHEYLRNLRSKHIAHSVNAFEECDTVGMLVGFPGKAGRVGGVGLVMKRAVGLSQKQLLKAVDHIAILVGHLTSEIEAMRLTVYTDFKEAHQAGEKMIAAPLIKLTDRAKVGQRRK